MKTKLAYRNIKKYIILINKRFDQEICNSIVNKTLRHLLKANQFIVFIVIIYSHFLNLLALVFYRKHFFNLKGQEANRLRNSLAPLSWAILKIDNFVGVVSSLHIYGDEKINKIKQKNESNLTFFPFVVIGSGPSGMATAAKIAKKFPGEVAIIERGDFFEVSKTKHPGAEFYNKWDKGGINSTFYKERISFSSGNCVGGGSEINSGLFHKPDPDFLKRWTEEFNIKNLTMCSLKPFLNEVNT